MINCRCKPTVILENLMKPEKIELYNPTKVIAGIQKQKLIAALIPILLVLASFVINIYFPTNWTQYISLTGLIMYFIISMAFKINRRLFYPENEPKLVFPISGKIVEINSEYIEVSKKTFDIADLRFAGADFSVNDIKGKIFLFSENNSVGELIGVVPYNATCKISLPAKADIDFKIGDKVVAGDVIISLPEKNLLTADEGE